MRRKVIWIVAAAVTGAALAAGVVFGPRMLRALPGFEVRSVEVSGADLLEPREVVRAAGVRAGESVWNDADRWVAALERHPVIESARVSRRLPGTLRIEITEKRAVAYVDDGTLGPATASGERLPIDPIRAPADLPIARGDDGREVPVAMLAEVGRLAVVDPGLLAEVSEIQATDSTGEVLRLSHRNADIVVPVGASAGRLSELRAVMADLDGKVDSQEGGEVARLDLRFADQIVVRLPSSVQKP